MLARVVRRVREARLVDDVVVATTRSEGDDAIAELAEAEGWLLFRGSEEDVLDRYWQAAKAHDADVIVRVCSDCPMTSPQVIDGVVEALLDDPECDYAANNFAPASYPKGLDVEVFRRGALELAWREDTRMEWREHVTPYLRRNPDRFRQRALQHSEDLSASRWTVDTPEDLAFIRALIGAAPEAADWLSCVEVERAHPEWSTLNRHVEQRRVPS